jgi:LacI family transcriptional regulator
LRRATITQVAARAGVSGATVSRVLNGYPFVNDEVRTRVLAAAEELDYRPDAVARSMRTGESRAIGFVVSDLANPLFSAIAAGADEILHSSGYSLVLASSAGDPEREAEAIAALGQRRVDALILSIADERAPGLAERLRTFRSVVLVDRQLRGSRADVVHSEHRLGMEAAVAHLRALGHADIGLIAGSQAQLGSRARVRAFRNALDGAVDQRLVRTGELSRETGYLAAQELLALDEPPSALIAGNNQLFAGVVAAVHDLRLRVPDDLSLVACDDSDLARLHEPPIDVVDRDPYELGRAAAQLVLARLAEPESPPRRTVLPTRFEARASSTAPAERVR